LLDFLTREFGTLSEKDLSCEPGKLVSRQVMVTRREIFVEKLLILLFV
jgi:hypothetical protein